MARQLSPRAARRSKLACYRGGVYAAIPGCLALLLNACDNTGSALDSPSSSGLFSNPVNTAVETAVVVAQPPSYRPHISYRENDGFDRALNSAMRGDTPSITVAFEPAYLSRVQLEEPVSRANNATRIHFWLQEVSKSGGKVIACQEPEPEQRRMLGVLVSLILGVIAQAVHDYILYAPAENYHARAVFDRDTARLKRVEFLRRDETEDVSCSTLLPKV